MAEGIYILPADDRRKFAKIITRVWGDEEFKQRWEAEPSAVLTEYGIDYPNNVAPPPIPPRPESELAVEALEALSAGDCFGTAGSLGTATSCAGTFGTYGCYSPAEPTVG